jgi:hypothetical protein
MPAQSPKWWDMNPSNEIVVLFKSLFRVFVANEHQEMNVSSNRIVNQLV